MRKTAEHDDSKPPFRTLAQARKVARAITSVDGRPRAIIRQESRGDFAVRVGVPVRLGRDDKLAEWSGPVTHTTRAVPTRRAGCYRSMCSCGWYGDMRRVKQTAADDGAVHEAAMAGQAQARVIERRAAKPKPVLAPENRKRAASARKAMNAGGYTDEPRSDVTDILCDLRHYCDANGLKFADVLWQASDHYSAESKNPAESCAVSYPAPPVTGSTDPLAARKAVDALPTRDPKNDILCAYCGSDEVETLDWVSAKDNKPTGSYEGDDESSSWCPNCRGHHGTTDRASWDVYPYLECEGCGDKLDKKHGNIRLVPCDDISIGEFVMNCTDCTRVDPTTEAN